VRERGREWATRRIGDWGKKGDVIGRAKNSARPRFDLVYRVSAPVLSRATRVSFFADGYE